MIKIIQLITGGNLISSTRTIIKKIGDKNYDFENIEQEINEENVNTIFNESITIVGEKEEKVSENREKRTTLRTTSLTPLHAAIIAEKKDLVELLLEKKADINAICKTTCVGRIYTFKNSQWHDNEPAKTENVSMNALELAEKYSSDEIKNVVRRRVAISP
jgi:hypothetical protein